MNVEPTSLADWVSDRSGRNASSFRSLESVLWIALEPIETAPRNRPILALRESGRPVECALRWVHRNYASPETAGWVWVAEGEDQPPEAWEGGFCLGDESGSHPPDPPALWAPRRPYRCVHCNGWGAREPGALCEACAKTRSLAGCRGTPSDHAMQISDAFDAAAKAKMAPEEARGAFEQHLEALYDAAVEAREPSGAPICDPVEFADRLESMLAEFGIASNCARDLEILREMATADTKGPPADTARPVRHSPRTGGGSANDVRELI